MTKFLDGPAATVMLMIKRSPKLLRVTHDESKGVKGWDALDRLRDTPNKRERVYVYRLAEPVVHIHLKMDRGCGWYPLASYRLFERQPDDATARDTTLWRAWATEHGADVVREIKEREARPFQPGDVLELPPANPETGPAGDLFTQEAGGGGGRGAIVR